MNIVFSFHAEYRMKKRKFLREEIIDAIKNPDKTTKKYEKYYYQKKISRGTVEVVCEKTEKSLKVITLYWL
ncbi:MAG TPA: DUF4258 domain-containing protein [Candidatus Nanoarchaeia archaeon]|nr:DUF4258 domain-containing protein [Candidatus Nanoarchaeia archaeon]